MAIQVRKLWEGSSGVTVEGLGEMGGKEWGGATGDAWVLQGGQSSE